MNYAELVNQIKAKKSFLCVGLDTDITKIPKHLQEYDNPILEFNKQIIDATHHFCVAYKPNIAFYESLGSKGWDILAETVAYIPENIFTIADAKRGDIGNTAKMYAKTFFETYNFHSVTVAPYMGKDSVTPFLEFENKWAIVLALTSNEGALDFQFFKSENKELFKEVFEKVQTWGSPNNTMFVVGATRGELIQEARKAAPNSFFLVPGVGKQGGSLKDVVTYGITKDCGLLVNSSRGIIYADSSENFTQFVTEEAKKIQQEMEIALTQYGII